MNLVKNKAQNGRGTSNCHTADNKKQISFRTFEQSLNSRNQSLNTHEHSPLPKQTYNFQTQNAMNYASHPHLNYPNSQLNESRFRQNVPYFQRNIIQNYSPSFGCSTVKKNVYQNFQNPQITQRPVQLINHHSSLGSFRNPAQNQLMLRSVDSQFPKRKMVQNNFTDNQLKNCKEKDYSKEQRNQQIKSKLLADIINKARKHHYKYSQQLNYRGYQNAKQKVNMQINEYVKFNSNIFLRLHSKERKQ